VAAQYDINWAGMVPLACITAGPNPMLLHKCFIWYIGPTSDFPILLYPVFNHYGYMKNNTPYRSECTCPLSEDMGYCNTFDLISQFIFYSNSSKSADPSDLLKPLLELLTEYTDSELTSAAFSAHARSNFSFCMNDQFGSCSLLTFSNYANMEHDVSSLYHQVPYGNN
jgi:hypothetical protein